MGLNSAILEFNEGPKGVYDVLKHFNISSGIVMETSSAKKFAR